MTRYWIKIVLGALLIFAVGMAAWTGVRKGVNTVHVLTATADPITIPIKIVNFRVDGASVGRLERLKLLRSAPEKLASVELTVRVDSAAVIERLRNCILRIDDLEHLDEQTTFVCVTGDNPAAIGDFEPFGEVLLEGTDLRLPLLLPAAAVRDFQNKGWQGADSMVPALPAVPPVPQTTVGAEATTGATTTSP